MSKTLPPTSSPIGDGAIFGAHDEIDGASNGRGIQKTAMSSGLKD